jgi:fermentation-respiration switch protein FrsA (DUF1100 family)
MAVAPELAVAIVPVGLKVPAFAWAGTLEGPPVGDSDGAVGDVGPALLFAAATCADSPALLTAVIQ